MKERPGQKYSRHNLRTYNKHVKLRNVEPIGRRGGQRIQCPMAMLLRRAYGKCQLNIHNSLLFITKTASDFGKHSTQVSHYLTAFLSICICLSDFGDILPS